MSGCTMCGEARNWSEQAYLGQELLQWQLHLGLVQGQEQPGALELEPALGLMRA